MTEHSITIDFDKPAGYFAGADEAYKAFCSCGWGEDHWHHTDNEDDAERNAQGEALEHLRDVDDLKDFVIKVREVTTWTMTISAKAFEDALDGVQNVINEADDCVNDLALADSDENHFETDGGYQLPDGHGYSVDYLVTNRGQLITIGAVEGADL